MQTLAKLTPPKLSNAYPRERLFATLDQFRKSPVVWICGPPGAGKTTLVASYLAQRKLKPLWYRLDEGDSDPATLFYYLAAAREATPRKKKPLPQFTPEYAQGLPAFTRMYFRDFYQRLAQPFTLVFDNYQDAGEKTRLHEVMQYALAEVPEHSNVFVISRAEPPAELARLRASDILRIVGPEAMRLTFEESKGIVNNRSVVCSEEALKQLTEQTQGWAAGVTLLCELGDAALAKPAVADQAQLQTVFDYFAGEVFQNADRKTQDFLMETAFLPSLTAAMAEQLTAHRDAEQILSALAGKNYFTLRDQSAPPVYHYHPMFREFLLARAKESFLKARLSALKSDAARLLGSNGMVEEAAELWLENESWEALGNLAIEQAPALLKKGRHQTLENWLAQIADSLLDGQPWLLYWRASGRLPFAPAQSHRWFEKAFERFAARGDRAGVFRSWAGIIAAIRFEQDCDITQYDRWIPVLEKLLVEDSSFPSEEIEYEVAESMVRAMYWRMPLHPDYPRWKQRALALAHSSPDIGRRAYTIFMTAIYELLSGHFAEARALIESVAAVELRQLPPLVQNFGYMVLAYYQRETGQGEASLKTVVKGLENSALTGVHIWDFHLRGHGVYQALSSDQLDTAEKLLAEMAQARNVNVPGENAWYHYLSAWLAARRGDFAASRVHAQTAFELVPGWYYFEAWAHCALANVLCELDDHKGAETHVENMLAIARGIGSDRLLYDGLLMRAQAWFNAGDETRGLAALAEGMRLGRQRGYRHTESWAGKNAVALYTRALQAGIETEYVRVIIRQHKLAPKSPDTDDWPWPIRIFTLGRFQVLINDEALTFSTKAPKKPIALLKAIIAFGGHYVPERKLTDALWGDEEGDAAHEALNVNVHRLRKLLGDAEAIQVQEGKIGLDPRRCWIDVWAFERLLSQQTDRALALYRGAFLPEETEESWSVSMREKLRAQFIRHSAQLARKRSDAGELEKAIECYLRGLEADDLAEEFYQGAMQCYQQLNRRAEALAVYRRMRQTLSITLGIKPSPASEALYRALSAE